MRLHCRLAAVSLLALAVAACGDPAEEADDPVATDVTAVDPAIEPIEGDEDEALENDGTDVAATDEADDTAAPAPTPTANRTATPAPTPTRVAAAPPQTFTTCAVCHSVDAGENGVGPHLANVVGRRAGSVGGFNYSDAMQDANLTWTEANLQRYLLDPNAVVPGGTMPDPGLDQGQVREIINFLKTL